MLSNIFLITFINKSFIKQVSYLYIIWKYNMYSYLTMQSESYCYSEWNVL